MLFALPAQAQQLDVTFRFIPDVTPPGYTDVVRAYLPGSFNNWGPNSSGQIAVNAPSLMTYVEGLNEYRYTQALTIGQNYTYKVHYHRNATGTSYVWLTDPVNPMFTGPNNDSVVQVRDPMVFQLAREQNSAGRVYAVSAGIFGTKEITAVRVWLNGVESDGLAHFDADTRIFRRVLATTLPAASQFKIEATDVDGGTATAEIGVQPPTVVDQPRPAGLRNGITYVDDTTIRLSLFAPSKEFVHVIGAFNDWTVSDDFVMFRDRQDDNNVWWWTEISGLTPGQEYGFQYLVEGELRIADPYSELVLDPSHDSFISASTYPNRPAYPTGQTTGFVTIVQPGRPAFEWQSNDYVRPAPEDLIIYELLLRDFVANHSYQTLRDTLDYLQRLGVTAIGLMPVSQFDGNLSWGYNPTFHLALEKAYGTRDAFKQLVDEAHSRGMAVILDVVYNHVHDRSPIVQLYGPNAGNPFLTVPASHPYNVFLQMNHSHPFVHDLIDQANERWMTEYRIDGFRYDLTKGFMVSGSVDGYNAQRIGNLKRMADRVWDDVDPNALLILEHFAANSEEQELANYRRGSTNPGFLLWNNQNRQYSQAAMGYLSDNSMSSDFRNSYAPNRQMPVENLVTYMESHDEQWLMFRNRAYGPSAGDYNVRDLHTALDRQKLVAAFFLTIPGPRMIWQFGELGYGWGINGEECLRDGGSGTSECPAAAPGRTAQKPLPWASPRQYHLDTNRSRLYKVYSELLRLRNDHAVFTSPSTQVDLRVGQGIADRRIRLSNSDMNVVIIGNFGLTTTSVDPNFHHSGTWYEFLSGTSVSVTNANAAVTLLPGEWRLYTSVYVEPAEPNLLGVSSEEPGRTPSSFALQSAYPNPAQGAVTVPFSLASGDHVRLSVYDLLGRRVATLVDEALPAGEHAATLPGENLPAGVYVIRLEAGSQSATSRVTIVR
ncbi:hypothetical protein BH23BAC4_BH23BAC4_02650 [soil metagenome]